MLTDLVQGLVQGRHHGNIQLGRAERYNNQKPEINLSLRIRNSQLLTK